MTSDEQIRVGRIYWCEVAQTNMEGRFSEKGRRPVLVVSIEGIYASVYPCSSKPNDRGESEHLGDLLGLGEMYLIYGHGLFFASASALSAPAIDWPEWPRWRRNHHRMVEHDLRLFRAAHAQRLAAGLRAPRTQSAFSTSLASRLDAETIRRLTPPPAERPKPSLPRPTKPREPTAGELFEEALKALPPRSILDADKE
jgi:hypothetical protein